MDDRHRLPNQPRPSDPRFHDPVSASDSKCRSNFLHCSYTAGQAFINTINSQNHSKMTAGAGSEAKRDTFQRLVE